MEATAKKQITVETTVYAPIEKVWESWTEPRHIVQWNTASPDWHTPRAENDLRPGGKFLSRMEARDGSFGFDFYGTYDEVIPKSLISYTMGDGRKAKNSFKSAGDGVKIVTVFEAEDVNSPEMQKGGWQAILDSFKSYTEKL